MILLNQKKGYEKQLTNKRTERFYVLYVYTRDFMKKVLLATWALMDR